MIGRFPRESLWFLSRCRVSNLACHVGDVVGGQREEGCIAHSYLMYDALLNKRIALGNQTIVHLS